MKNASSFVLGLVMTAVLSAAGSCGATNGDAAAVKLVNASASMMADAFQAGIPSIFAQLHLGNGACQ
jgi:hypothetical protein